MEPYQGRSTRPRTMVGLAVTACAVLAMAAPGLPVGAVSETAAPETSPELMGRAQMTEAALGGLAVRPPGEGRVWHGAMPEAGTEPARARDADVPGRFPTIQSAIDAAADGDTITVAPGRYEGAISFRGKDVVIRSTSGPAVTILAANLAKGPVVAFSGEETSGAVLQGFTVQGFFEGNGNQKPAVKIGAGGAPLIRDNLFLENTRCGAIDASSANPVIRDNVFMGNMSFYCGAGIGGVATRGGTIEGNAFFGNHGYGIRTRSGVVTHNVLVHNFVGPGSATADLVVSGGTAIDNLLVQEPGAGESAVFGTVLHNTFVVGQTGIRFGDGLIQGNVIWRKPGETLTLVEETLPGPPARNWRGGRYRAPPHWRARRGRYAARRAPDFRRGDA